MIHLENSNMLMAKAKVEDIQWLNELMGIYASLLTMCPDNPALIDMQIEIGRLKEHINTHDYAPGESKRQATERMLGVVDNRARRFAGESI